MQVLKDRVPNRCKIAIVEAFKTLFKGPQSTKAKEIFLTHNGRSCLVELIKNPFFSLPLKATVVECLYLSFLSDDDDSKDAIPIVPKSKPPKL